MDRLHAASFQMPQMGAPAALRNQQRQPPPVPQGIPQSHAQHAPHAPHAPGPIPGSAPPISASIPPPPGPPPPTIFGAFPDHGRLPIRMPADMLNTQVFPDHGMLDEANEAKRRRIARACDTCRRKKIKCDGKLPACSHCANYKTECIFTQTEKKRNPSKGPKYIEGLENRLGRMENLLRLSGLLGEDDDGATDLGTLEKRLAEKSQQSRQNSQSASNPNSPTQATSVRDSNALTPHSSLTSPEPIRENSEKRKSFSPEKEKEEEEEEAAALSEMMCSLVTNNLGETRYIGSSSSYSIFSPKGVQWVNEKMGDTSFQRMISDVSIDDHKWTAWKPDVFQDLFRRQVFIQLPSKPDALSLLKDFFENFNCMFPLFHQPTFMHLVEREYSNEPYQGSGWWASLNVALAIAYRLRVMSKLVPVEEDDKAWAYMKNAMSSYSELAMRNTDLLSVQALLGMALFMQGTPNPQPSFLLVASAIRLSHSIGLHKRGTGFNLNPVEIEQRKRVFWIGYMLDKDLCLRSGRPPAQDDNDMNVELPDADPVDGIGNIPLADGRGKMNLFRVMCELSTIESKVYNRLYATGATKQSDEELLNTIGELDQELDDWKDSIPIDFRPEHEIRASHTPLILHVVMLHFTYYNCLTTIHRMSIHHGYWTSRLSNHTIQGLSARPLNPRIFSSAALCTTAARASISLLKYIPQGDFPSVWMILYYPVSALVTLFSNILQNPLDTKARSDARLMNVVVTFLSMLGHEAETGGVHRMLGVCAEFERIAKAIIDKAEGERSVRRKKRSHEALTATVPVPEMAAPPPPRVMSAAAPSAMSSSNSGVSVGNGNGNGSGNSTNVTAQMPISQPMMGSNMMPANTVTTMPQASQSQASSLPNSMLTPPVQDDRPNSSHSYGSITPPMTSRHPSAASIPPPLVWRTDSVSSVYANSNGSLSQSSPGYASFVDMAGGFGSAGAGSSSGNLTPVFPIDGLQSPPIDTGGVMLPVDLFSLPMTLDWNWAEMSGGAYPSVENGNFGRTL